MPIVVIPFVFALFWLYFFNKSGRTALREPFIKSIVAMFVATVAITESASIFGLVGRASSVVLWLVPLIALGFALRSNFAVTAGAFGKRLRDGISGVPTFALVVAGLILLVTFVIAIASAPNTYDSQTYHLARVMYWVQNGSVAHYPTIILRQLYQPPLSEIAIMQTYLLGGGDRFANLVQWLTLAGCAAATSRIGAEIGLDSGKQALTAALAMTIPGAIVQASSTQNDLVAAFLVAAFFLFLYRAVRDDHRGDFLWAGAALGLALLTKGTNYLYCFPIGLFFALLGFLRTTEKRRFAVRIAGVLLLALALNLGHFARNFDLFGSPVSTAEDDVRNKDLTAAMIAANVARNLAVNLGTKSVSLRRSIESAMTSVFGAELKNPKSTWLENEFKVEFSTHEDLTGNFTHLLLLLIALPASAVIVRKSRDIAVMGLIFSIPFGFFLLSALLKWQIWSARLQLPLFILGTVLIAFVMSKIKLRGVGEIVTAICFTAAVPFLLFAEPRRVLAADGSFVLFSESRQNQLFKNLPDAGPLYTAAAEVVRREAPESVGIAIEYNDFDYPLWTLLKADAADPPTICHVGLANVSKRIKPKCQGPKIVFTTKETNVIDGIKYVEIWKGDVVRVLRQEAQ